MMYVLDVNSKQPLYVQLYEALKKQILQEYAIGDKIPSIRKIAVMYNVSKNTVEEAFTQLVIEGYIDSIPKSGYVVQDLNELKTKKKKAPKNTVAKEEPAYLYDFFPARLEKGSFPMKTWKRLFSKAVNEELDMGGYALGQGEYGLRCEIASYLNASRGVQAVASNVVICSGFGNAMELLCKLFKDEFDSVCMEEPGYHVATEVFEQMGLSVEKVRVTKLGIDIEALKRAASKVVYVTPSHQYPTGVAMPVSKRGELLKWASLNQGYIIEDDYDSEMCYENRPIPALQGLDKEQRVIYIGTFSKSLSPSLRVSYMLLPQVLMNRYLKLYDAFFPRVDLMTQKTLELFMKEGFWERHLKKIRTQNKKKHHLMRQMLQKHLGKSMEIVAQGGGLAILILPIGKFDWEKFKQLSYTKRIKIYLAKERCGGEWEAVRMGFGGLSLEEIPQAIECFSEVWHESFT